MPEVQVVVEDSSGSDPTYMSLANYVLIPGNSFYGTDDFCVMKYEAKLEYQNNIELDGNVDNDPAHDYDLRYGINESDFVPVSSPSGRPWTYIKRGENGAATGEGAIEACQSLGTGYDLSHSQ